MLPARRSRAHWFQWYKDNPEADVAEQARYYGVKSAAFQGFLASLGLSFADGRPKKALGKLGL